MKFAPNSSLEKCIVILPTRGRVLWLVNSKLFLELVKSDAYDKYHGRNKGENAVRTILEY